MDRKTPTSDAGGDVAVELSTGVREGRKAGEGSSRWALARLALIFLGLHGSLRALATLADLGRGDDPGYLAWCALEHTSRTALAWTLAIWAILPGSHLPAEGDAQKD